MILTTRKEIRDSWGVDVTDLSQKESQELKKKIDKNTIACSAGKYGLNGLLFEDLKTGQLYKITRRSNNLYIFY